MEPPLSINFPPRTLDETSSVPCDLTQGAVQFCNEEAGHNLETSPASVAPVCIVGMHRSGTSLVARLLDACGLFLGREEELAGPAVDNPDGFWENLNFVGLNEELLSRFGGSWNEPPDFPARWEFSPEIAPLLERACELVGRFGSQSHWGWKDPRNSLTIPFWQRIIPSLRVVVCVRNPLEVAHSLFVRGDSTCTVQFRLWLDYYRRILSATSPAGRIVTHYQSYFQDPRAEVRRVAGRLGLNVSDEAVDRVCAHVSGDLRHHHSTTDELKEAGAPDELIELYLRLCEEAGPLCRQFIERENINRANSSAPPRDGSAVSHTLQLMRMNNQLAKSAERLRLLEQKLDGLEAQFHEVRASLLPLMRALDALRGLRAWLRSALRRDQN